MYGRHLSNIFDHRRPQAELLHCFSFHAMQNGREAVRQEWQHHLDWINANVIGPPKATDHYTQAQLVGMGMIGIYKSVLECDGYKLDFSAFSSAEASNVP